MYDQKFYNIDLNTETKKNRKGLFSARKFSYRAIKAIEQLKELFYFQIFRCDQMHKIKENLKQEKTKKQIADSPSPQ